MKGEFGMRQACRFGFIAMMCLMLQAGAAPAEPDEASLEIGVGRVVLTPQKPMWMSGYAFRDRPAEGKDQDLYAKVMAIRDASGAVSVLIGSDVIGWPRRISQTTAALIEERHGVPRERVMLTASHTHSGPVFRDNLRTMYNMGDEQWALVEEYTNGIPDLLLQAVDQAVEDLEPCRLYWGVGQAGFAKNRRGYTPGGIAHDFNPIGPVDHDVPVFKAVREDGSIKAFAFGYACHNTVLALFTWSGDYAGYAQEYLEEAAPGSTAIFSSGCGGDQNPLPRRSIELAKKYGRELADAVLAVASGDMAEVRGPLSAQYREIDLPLSEPPTREEVEAQAKSDNRFIRARAESLLKTFDEKGALDPAYPYPIQIWDFASGQRIVALGGEVVVDYSLLLKYHLGRKNLYVIGYANDVMAYIPSIRVLREGGYEGSESMIYYGMHGPWSPQIEPMIIGTVHEMVGKEVDLTPR